MYRALVIFFARISIKFGSKEPVDSAITVLTLFQVSIVGLLFWVIKMHFTIPLNKTYFMILCSCIVFFNLFYLSKKLHQSIDQNSMQPVSIYQALAGVLLYFLGTVGVVLLLIPLSKL